MERLRIIWEEDLMESKAYYSHMSGAAARTKDLKYK